MSEQMYYVTNPNKEEKFGVLVEDGDVVLTPRYLTFALNRPFEWLVNTCRERNWKLERVYASKEEYKRDRGID